MNTKSRLLLSVALTLSSGLAHADLSANIGWASDYFYRGILQAPTSASAGLDFERNGFYVGTWATDVKDGLEVDGYFGYATEIQDVSYSVGFTGYYSTGDFDDTYQEINMGLGYGWATLDVAVGEYDNFDAGTQDYTYYALTIANKGFYGKLASFTQDFEGEYLELGYGTSLAELDIGFAAIFANSDLVGDSTESLVFTIGKTFDIQ
jgi:uncharacterized protein (TIGR02001 family)